MALSVSSGTDAVKKARAWIGTPYCYGGGHGGAVPIGTCVDCSGLVNQVYGTTGNTYTQVGLGAPIASINNAQPGDLVFFGAQVPGEPHHVGIYVGNGLMIDAPHTGTLVGQRSINGYGQINAVRRLVGTGSMANGNSNNPSGGVQFTYAQLEGLWIQAGGNPQSAAVAAAVAMAESGGNSQATDNDSNGSVDRGLWQINSIHGAQSTYDVMGNARAAVAISNNGSNWSPWVTYNTGAYRKYLQSGIAPDMSVPINATNAAANTGQPQQAETMSIWGDVTGIAKCIAMPALCVADKTQGAASGYAGKLVLGIIGMVLNPLIQIVAGILGITAGASFMIIGIYLMIMDTQTGRKATGLGLTAAGAATGQPELMAAGGATRGGTMGMARAAGAQRTQTIRGQQVAARQQAGHTAVTQREVYRQQEMATREDMRNRAYAYRQEQTQQRSATMQAARQAAMTERQRQEHRQKMSRARQRARLADRNK